jgi:hypothetical protein
MEDNAINKEAPVALPVRLLNSGQPLQGGQWFLLDAVGFRVGLVYTEEFGDYLVELINATNTAPCAFCKLDTPISLIRNCLTCSVNFCTRGEDDDRFCVIAHENMHEDRNPDPLPVEHPALNSGRVNCYACGKSLPKNEAVEALNTFFCDDICLRYAEVRALTTEVDIDSPSLEDTTFNHADPRNR